MNYWEQVQNVIQRQYGYTNISHLMQNKSEVWEKNVGNIKENFVKDVLDFDTCTDSALDNYWGKFFKITREFLDNEGNTLKLSREEYIRVLKIKAFGCSYDGGLKELNLFLNNLFLEKGQAYCIDRQDMSMEYFFIQCGLSDAEKFIYLNRDVFPRPSGVLVRANFVEERYFGFGTYNDRDPRDGITGFGTYEELNEGKTGTYED